MRPSRLASDIVSAVDHDDPPRAIQAHIYDLISEGLSSSEAAELAERLTPRVARALESIYAQAVQRGHDPPFRFNSSSPGYIQGTYFAEPRDPDEVRAAKLARARLGDIISAVRNLSFGDFELLCAKLLQDLGASHAVRTPHASDQGIDFYGRLVLGQLAPAFPFLRLEDSIAIWLVGQAKHYPNSAVQPSEVRELAGAILLARHREFTVKDVYPDMDLRSCDPIVGLFITSGQFTRGGLRIADESGIISKDGFQLSTFLADHGHGLTYVDGRPSFSQEAFADWLHSPPRP